MATFAGSGSAGSSSSSSSSVKPATTCTSSYLGTSPKHSGNGTAGVLTRRGRKRSPLTPATPPPAKRVTCSTSTSGTQTPTPPSSPSFPSSPSSPLSSPSSPLSSSSKPGKGPPFLAANQFPSLHEVELTEVDRSYTKQLLACVDVLLMVVNDNEYRAVLGLMESIKAGGKIVQATSNSVTFLIGMYGKFLSAVVKTSPGGQGFNGAEQKTIRAVEVVKPSVVISVGVAYGKSKESQQLGDVLVCELVNDYTYKRLGVDETRIRNPQPPVGGRLLDIFENYVGWRKERGKGEFCRVKVGPLVSGPDLVDNRGEKEKIFKIFRDAIGGEMEGAAILSAIHGIKGTHKPEGIVIKAICDWGDGSKNKQWQPFAAHAAADYVLHHLKKEAFGDLARKGRFVPETCSVSSSETSDTGGSGTSITNSLQQFLISFGKEQTGEKGEREVRGRQICYESKWRFHSFQEPMVWDGRAQDLDTGTSVEVKHFDTSKRAVEAAIRKLCKKLTDKGVLRDPL